MSLPGWAAGVKSFLAKTPLVLHNIPEDKQLDPAWVKSLYQRGNATVYRKSRNELRYIGMPAGGLHAGTVYLGGDGRLWLWGIYNDEREGVDPKTVLWNDGTKEVKVRNRDGACYVEPAIADNKRVLEQGFALRVRQGSKTWIREFRESEWPEISFEATYPVARIHFRDPEFPVSVIMQAGAIFTPLDARNAALPATVFSLECSNNTATPVAVEVLGWLENGASKVSAKNEDGERQNEVINHQHATTVMGTFLTTSDEVKSRRDFGSTSITCVGKADRVHTALEPWPLNDRCFEGHQPAVTKTTAQEKLVGGLVKSIRLAPKGKAAADFVISWHFDHPLAKLKKLEETKTGYYYGTRFPNAAAVGEYIAANFERLHGQSILWRDTYYDSTLPHWFLERTFLNIGTLATANTYRFANGRFWGWEGVNACEGTCTHVWQYAQAMGRIFPELERDARERTDLGIAMQPDGGIIFRAEYESRPAIDGQAGTLLRIYREHQLSTDNAFLQRNWDKIRKAAVFLMAQDKNGDGMTDTPMENTLDAVWEGEIAWIVGLSIAAVRACQKMAEEMGDSDFAARCKTYADKGGRNMADLLFNGEYFIHRPDAIAGRKKLGSYNTCHIDQVYGQAWAWQVGLGRLWDKEKTMSALRSLWKYNFAPDVGPYIQTHTGGRPYALAGEGGMVMNTNPKNEPNPYGDEVTWQLGYFHECMSGFEHQVAAHMMAEGMTDEALVMTRAIHDRHHAAKRNPFNEIECSDHYARAMASYGTFITACGFEYHGPKGYLHFAPRWQAENFRAPFTTAAGWGTYVQQRKGNVQHHAVILKYGELQLQELGVEGAPGRRLQSVTVMVEGRLIPATFEQEDKGIRITLKSRTTISTGQQLKATLNFIA
ncbi:hypothetical protein FPE01S_01_10500 [Flavihumibacter petaseus NBRC 106054]|uniref:Glycosidase n=1 Tax=Flavihumibacter petaseus NBRC 106054 TaxID=1220578 RepID=A0A0E9MWC4_9BACT|nr:hypothetical protein FPE01S_01_10500 [Flavihumibacter petaseus NBRC 106054]